jgi:peptide/nickel transport system substrate-binding protein
MGLVVEPLLACRLDKVQPGLAESWEALADRINFRLRAGARWHDDRPLTVVDVQATLEAVLRSTSRLPLLRAQLADVTAVEIVGERVVRLRLERPSLEVLAGLCNIPILPESAVRGGPSAIAAFGRQPMGTGPFRFASWERGRRIRLAAHVGAWSGRPRIDEIAFEIDGDLTRALGRIRRGELDVLPRLLESHYPEQVMPAALGDSAVLYRLSPERFSVLVFNHRRELLADARVRRALSMLWDRDRFADEFHHRLVRPAIGLLSSEVQGWNGFDPGRAARLLDEVGLRDSDADGVRDRAGAPLRLVFLYATGSRVAAAEARAYAMDLRRVGLLLDPVAVDFAGLSGRLEAGAFDIAPVTWDGRLSDSPRLLLGSEGPLGLTGYRSEALLGILDSLRVAGATRSDQLARLSSLLQADMPLAPLYRHDVAAVVGKRVHGLSGEGADLDLSRVWLEP